MSLFGTEHEKMVKKALLEEIEHDEEIWNRVQSTFLPLPNGEYNRDAVKKRDSERQELLDKINSRILKNKIQLYELIKKEFE